MHVIRAIGSGYAETVTLDVTDACRINTGLAIGATNRPRVALGIRRGEARRRDRRSPNRRL